MIDGRTSRWAGHRDRRRAQFVEAAVRTIERVGPSATVDQIAAEAGVSRQVLYRQFDDRDDLDRAIADHAATLLVEQLTPQLDVDAGVQAGVRHAITVYLGFIDAHLALYRFVRTRQSDAVPEAAARRVKDTISGTIAVLARSVMERSGRGYSALAETTAIALVGMADAVIAAWLDDPRGLTRDELVQHLVALALGLLDAAVEPAGNRIR